MISQCGLIGPVRRRKSGLSVQLLSSNCHDVRNPKARRFTAGGAATRDDRLGGRRSRLEKGRRHDEPRQRHGGKGPASPSSMITSPTRARFCARPLNCRHSACSIRMAIARVRRFRSTACAAGGHSPRAEQSGRLPFGRACLPIAAERQGRAKCRGAWARDVAKTDRGGTGQDEGARRTVERRRSCRHCARCPGRRTGGSVLSKGEKSNWPLEAAFEMALAYVAAHDPKAALPMRTHETDRG